jgi:hypothetical protein
MLTYPDVEVEDRAEKPRRFRVTLARRLLTIVSEPMYVPSVLGDIADDSLQDAVLSIYHALGVPASVDLLSR